VEILRSRFKRRNGYLKWISITSWLM